MLEKQWIVKSFDSKKAETLSSALGLCPLTARLLCVRGHDTVEKAKNFLSGNLGCNYDPYLLKDMDLAVNRIKKAIQEKQRICVYGDYDVDGVTSTATLCDYLVKKDVPCTYFVPDRAEDGYGLNMRAIESIASEADLIITVDTGITAVEEVEFAKSLGVDVVITDHHNCDGEIPKACAVVDPYRPDCEYPFKQLAGVGVVYKLLSAIEGNSETIMQRYGDLIAIGTIADVMPVVDENRYITTLGLRRLCHSENLGLKALMARCNMPCGDELKINSAAVSFNLAPKINAPGRMKSANIAVELLLAEDRYIAEEIASELCAINKKRQATEQKIYEDARRKIERKGNSDVYVLSSYQWHQGVIGVVASKITENYSSPSVLFSFEGDVGKGSCRSIKGFSMLDAIKACSDLLEVYGGHELAAGITIKRQNLEAFERRINDYAHDKIKTAHEAVCVDVDAEVNGSEIHLKQAYELCKIEPYGSLNPIPLLLLRDATIKNISPLSGGKHIKFDLECKGCRRPLSAVYFNMPHSEFKFYNGDCGDVLFALEVNTFMGRSEAKLIVKKMRSGASTKAWLEKQNQYYLSAVSDDNYDNLPLSAVPNLAQFRVLFKVLKQELGDQKRRLSLCYIRGQVKELEPSMDIGFCALRIIMDVLKERELIEFEYCDDGEILDIQLVPSYRKVDLDKAPLLIKIKNNHKLY